MSLFFLDQQGPVAKIDCLSVNIGCSHADRSQDGKEASNTNILVPMPAVAEIILNQEVSVDKNAPPGCLVGLTGAIWIYR